MDHARHNVGVVVEPKGWSKRHRIENVSSADGCLDLPVGQRHRRSDHGTHDPIPGPVL